MKKYTIKIGNKKYKYNPNSELSMDFKKELMQSIKVPYYFMDTQTEQFYGEDWVVYKQDYWNDLVPKKRKSQYSVIEKIEVSNLGRVRVTNKQTHKSNIIPQENDPNYPEGYLRLKGYASLGHVYRMVARAFILNTPNEEPGYNKKYPVHHIDNNGYNNCLENLIYVSPELHSEIHFSKDI